MKKNITELAFPELGFFGENEIKGLAERLNGKSYMNFQIKSGNYAGNHTLIVQADDTGEGPEEVRNFFLSLALSYLARA